jgi:hypothetical protein
MYKPPDHRHTVPLKSDSTTDRRASFEYASSMQQTTKMPLRTRYLSTRLLAHCALALHAKTKPPHRLYEAYQSTYLIP